MRALIAVCLISACANHGVSLTGRGERLAVETRSDPTGFVVTGGSLATPLELPLWLDIDPDDNDGKCALFADALAVELSDGRIYVQQHSDLCTEPACRVIDGGAVSGAACLEAPLGFIHRIESLAGGLVMFAATAEGYGDLVIASYSPEAGQRDLARVGISPYGFVDARPIPGGVLFASPCELPRGCTEVVGDDLPIHYYEWTPDGGLRPLR